MSKIYLAIIDRGHAITTLGKESPFIPSLGRRIKEAEFNFPTGAFLGQELQRHGVHVVFTNTDIKVDTPLKARTDYANKVYREYCAKYGVNNVECIFISIHYNALDGTFAGANPEGLSVHIYLGQKGKAAGRLATLLSKYLPQGTRQINRGIVEQDLHVNRETNMPSALTENGFMDNPKEAMYMLNVNYQKETATDHAKAILEYFGIGYRPISQPITKEEDEMTEKAIVVTGHPDLSAAEILQGKLGDAGIHFKKNIIGKKVAKHLFVVGGNKDGLVADKFTVLSGATRRVTMDVVDDYKG